MAVYDWNPRLSEQELNAKYDTKIWPLVIDQYFVEPETADLHDSQTYIAMFPDSETASKLHEWSLDVGVPNPVMSSNLHVTMFHVNRASDKTWQNIGKMKPIVVEPDSTGAAVIMQPKRNLFVLNILSATLAKRRESMNKVLQMRMDNPGYFHMTLSYNVGPWRDRFVHKINFPIVFVREENRQPRS